MTVSQNLITGNGGDGIELGPQDIVLKGSISRNSIFDNGDDGIEINAVSAGVVSTYAVPDVVNNMIGFNGGHGIYNHVGRFSTGQAGSTPRVTFNTVYGNGGYGIKNEAAGTAALPVFQVWDCIFDQNAGLPGADIDTITPELPETSIWWTRFGAASGLNNNTTAAPGLVNPAARDFRLQSGSPMIDQGSTSPPAVPATDFFGTARLIDHAGIGNDGANYADKGAHERTSP